MNNRMIRIFLSSTFWDFQVERDLLNRTVFAELEAYCRSQGVSFQVIDLRWGIPEKSAYNNETMRICLDEIERCQRISPDMNFLILSGMRYGWRPLPGNISRADWEQMSVRMTDREKTELSKWYLQDENDCQGAYVLRRRTKDEESEWEKTEKSLQEILFPLASRSFEGEALVSYGMSATEQEIYKGFLTVINENSLRNTLVLLKNPSPEASDTEENGQTPDPGVEELRDKIIRQVGLENANEQIFRYNLGNEEEDLDSTPWLKKVYDFLRSRIDQQIARIQSQRTEEEEESLLIEELVRAEENFLHRPDKEKSFDVFLEKNQGRVLLLTGESGSGKSTWLKYWYYHHRGHAAACFSDTLHYGNSILYAARFCIAQLVEQGFLNPPETFPDYENLVSWLNENLNRIKSPSPVTIIFDSVDNMTDWRMVVGSLFGMKLSKNVRILISCVDNASLTEADRREDAPTFSLGQLDRAEGLVWLDSLLEKSGRRLCCAQRDLVAAAMPEHCTALYLYFLSFLCAALKSFEPIDFALPETAKDLARLLLKRQAQSYYPVLYRHAAGYLSLSSQGLSEQEMLELLSMDPEVVVEIKTQAQWNWDEKYHIPMVLWSRLYCMLLPLLTERYSGGVLTMRYRHSILNEVSQEKSKDGLLLPGEIEKLRVRMREYFEGEKQPWRFSQGTVNLRKLQELYPILVQLEEWERIGQLLSEPDYLESMLLAGNYHELIDQMILYRETRGLTDVRKKILDLLLAHPILFQTWGESFLPNAVGSGIWHLEEAKKTRSFWYLDEKTTDQEGQERMFYIPNLHLYPVALRSDRTLAVLVRRKKDTVICLYDLNNGRYLGVSAKFREALSISDGVRLFWKEECLIVRTRLCRYYFRYDKDKGDFYEDHRISCKNWSQIIKREGNVQNGEEAWEVSVFNHKDSNEDEGYWSVFCYVEDGFQEYLLPYEDSDELIISCFYTKAAVFKSGGDVRLFDLEEKKEIGYFHCLECVDLFWSDTGKELLIVRNDDYLSILPVSGEEREYLQPENLPINERKRSARVEYNSWTELEGDGISQLLDLGTGVLTADQHTEQFPICVTMAVEKDWGAAYYRAKWQNIVVIFQISTRKQLAYFQTDPIYRLESDRPVFYASEGGEKLVLVSKGRAHVLDMTGFFHELDQADQADSSARDLWTIRDAQTGIPVLPKAVLFRIRDEYIDTMKRWIPEVPNTKIADHLEKYLELLWGNRFSYIPDKKQWELDKLGGLPVYVQNDRYWLVDVEHSMVHVCDARGEWLCHYQSGKPFLAADVAGDTLYLLSKDELELYKYELCFCPANSEDACGTLGEQKGFTGVTNPLEASETDRLSMEPEFAADAGRTFDNNRSDKPKGLFAELSVKLGTLLILLLLVFAIRTSPRKGYVFITFYASEENDVTVEDMSFVALNKGNFRRYTVSGNVDSPECSMLLPSGSYDSYATYDGYALFLQTFTMNGNFYDGDIDIGTMIYRLITFDFYDGDGNPITPENVSVSEDGGETWGDLVWISENIYASAEKNSVNEINYLLCVDGRDPIAISANLAGYRTCSVSVVLDESDADEASYTVAEPNQDRYIMIGLLNMNEFTGQTNVQVDLLTDGKERTEIVSYTGNELYLLEAKEGCYCITFECEGYETVEKLCEIDGDTCFYFVYMNLNKLKEAE